MGLFGLFSRKNDLPNASKDKSDKDNHVQKSNLLSYEEQLKVFASLGYHFNEGVTKEMILRDVYQMNWEEETEKYIENHPFSVLYYTFGWRDTKVPKYNYSESCIWFDLEFFDPNSQYKWFMERMGTISNGEISFTDINILTDKEGYEWITFKVNGVSKKWKLGKAGYIDDSYVQRFSYLPSELNTKGRYTYFDNGGQQWVIDFVTEEEQSEFINKTGLKREWLGEGNHFSAPKE